MLWFILRMCGGPTLLWSKAIWTETSFWFREIKHIEISGWFSLIVHFEMEKRGTRNSAMDPFAIWVWNCVATPLRCFSQKHWFCFNVLSKRVFRLLHALPESKWSFGALCIIIKPILMPGSHFEHPFNNDIQTFNQSCINPLIYGTFFSKAVEISLGI